MILFVTEQYAGAEYLLPMLVRWRDKPPAPWVLAANGSSVELWREHGFSPLIPHNKSLTWLRDQWPALRPRAVITSASKGGDLEKAAVILARENGVPSAQFLDMWTGYGARFLDDSGVQVLPNRILAIDQRCVEEMTAEGLPPERMEIIGQPGWEAAFASLHDHTPDSHRVLLVSQPVAKYYGGSLGYDEGRFLRTCLEALDGLKGTLQVSLALHPEEQPLGLSGSPGGYGPISGLGIYRGAEDLKTAGVVLGMFSTLLVLAHAVGRKVASVQPGQLGRDMCPLSRWGLIPILKTPADVRRFLASSSFPVDNVNVTLALRGSLNRLEALCLKLYSTFQ